jgi:WhiB family redox-sensing transcriptional regulator
MVEKPVVKRATGMGTSDREWVDRSACLQSYDERFFPSRGDSNKEAKAICFDQCPVREECLEHALTKPERFGIWGGTSERERQEIRRRRNVEARLEMSRGKEKT